MRRTDLEAVEDRVLAPYAMRSGRSRGREHAEPEHPLRLAFQRDRDRIVHSSAFRRLEYKTQVFVNHEGDYYRTRLTHSMEAAQIARTLARVLGLNEDLAETVALAHDLGHTPFGHAGEHELDDLMKPHGGFEHNAQCLRIVELLERRYAAFPGLNLTFEVREGIVKHSPPYDRPLAARYEPGRAPCLEAQLVDYADEIAYNAHDIDDGLRSQMLDPEALESVDLWRESVTHTRRRLPGIDSGLERHQATRTLIDHLVTDLLEHTGRRIAELGIETVDDVRAHAQPLATPSPEVAPRLVALKGFLMENLYTHHRVVRMMRKAQRVMRDLFQAYMEDPRQLPAHILERCQRESEPVPRVIADYIAGMTDRFAVEEHGKLFDPPVRA
jgi:dGTPase